jgi:predicted nucleic acid-binding protein
MRIQRIYVDTSVIGECHDPEFAPWSKGLMQDFRDGTYQPVVSEVVATEIEGAPTIVQETYAELLALNPEFVEVTGEALALADAYQQRGILPAKSSADALHIALATVAEVDVLVSWNFRHVVHFDKIRLFNAVNLELGFKLLQIYSPREVTSYEAETAAQDDGDDPSDSRQSS